MRFRSRYLNVCAVSLLLLVGVSSCDPAQAATFESAPGQTMDQFVYSIRKDVAQLSREHRGVEVCGGIAERDGIYTVTLVPGERFQCAFTPPADYTGTSLHTHPTNADHGFSQGDYAAGPGYMVTQGFVYHQAGVRTDRAVKGR